MVKINMTEHGRSCAGVWRFSLFEVDTATWVQIQDKAVYISHNTNILGKSINPTILLPTDYG